MSRGALARQAPTRASGLRATWTPVLSTIAASMLALLPIVATSQTLPNFGLLTLLAWRLLRHEMWTARTAIGLGLAHDLIAGTPLGLSMSLWTLLLLAFDFVDNRLAWRDHWMEWLLAALAIAAASAADWKVAAMMGAPVPFASVVPHILISILVFPLVMRVVVALDRWRLSR